MERLYYLHEGMHEDAVEKVQPGPGATQSIQDAAKRKQLFLVEASPQMIINWFVMKVMAADNEKFEEDMMAQCTTTTRTKSFRIANSVLLTTLTTCM
jgi:hypothetical protein